VLVHGLPDGQDASTRRPARAIRGRSRVALAELVHAEVLFPIKWGGVWDYPYPEAHGLLRALPRRCSVPNGSCGVRTCPTSSATATYRQTLTYLARYSEFVPAEDMAAILGGNVLTLFPKRSG
jgi:hypothetical protein